MARIKLLLFYLFSIGPKGFLKALKSSFYENCTVYHFELPLDDVRFVKKKVNSESKIFYSFNEIPFRMKIKIKRTQGREKLHLFQYRLSTTTKLIVSFINGEFASYCFFAYSEEQFLLFRLKKDELYFFDCFTFPEFRGLNLIYNEVKYVIDIFRKHGYKKANVEIYDYNIPSIRAFAKLGFYKANVYYFKRVFFVKRVLKK